MGTRGPVPKRDSQRRRRNKPEVQATEADGAAEVAVPKGNARWHPVARRWFDALAVSGQSRFYEPSDWATAEVLAESMSRDLREGAPINSGRLAAYLKGFSSLLATEGDRRRVRLELSRPDADAGESGGSVSWLDAARRSSSG